MLYRVTQGYRGQVYVSWNVTEKSAEIDAEIQSWLYRVIQRG